MKVVSVNISGEKGTAKHPVPRVVIDDRGVRGDAHAGTWHRQVSVLSEEIVETFASELGRGVEPGEFAENITVAGSDLRHVAVLDSFKIGDVELQVTQIGKECHGDACAIFREAGKCVMPKEGVFCRVIRGGTVEPGDSVVFSARPLRFTIITMSDRAHRGEYEDRGGPTVRDAVDAFFAGKRWHAHVDNLVLPDDPGQLGDALEAACNASGDVVLTTGGTGIGPRDITPDVVKPMLDKEIPGIMEHIRVKCGSRNPNALLSRGVAGVRGRTLVYTLPGSVRGVRDYVSEILKTLEHLIFTVHGLDRH